jgi:hypothetical protein
MQAFYTMVIFLASQDAQQREADISNTDESRPKGREIPGRKGKIRILKFLKRVGNQGCTAHEQLQQSNIRMTTDEAALNAFFWAQIPQTTANMILEKTANKTETQQTRQIFPELTLVQFL